MTTYLLMNDVYACRARDRVVFLDLRRDKYFALSDSQSRVLPLIVPSMPQDAREDMFLINSSQKANQIAKGMVLKGLLTTDPAIGREFVPPAVEVPTRALMDEYLMGEIPIARRELLAFVRALSSARISLRFKGIKKVVHEIQQRKRDMLVGNEGRSVPALYSSFERMRPWLYTARERCLFDSLTLVKFLQRFDIQATWVFGVRAAPFGAHCWLQIGNLVLNDTPDMVGRYTPILAV